MKRFEQVVLEEFRSDLVACLVLSAVSGGVLFLTAWLLTWPTLFSAGLPAVVACFVATWPPLGLRAMLGNAQKTVLLPFFTIAWRALVVLVPVIWATATKWPEHKIFSLTLLGCYFPFLVLESALSIKRIRSLDR